ncbi:MAG: hypothetical protein A2X08_10955, partial [Bacteroidetes bacterium GWA2_32_17]
GTSTVVNSSIFDDGSKIGLFTAAPDQIFELRHSTPYVRLRDNNNTTDVNGTCVIEFGQQSGGAWSRTSYIGDGFSGFRALGIVLENSADFLISSNANPSANPGLFFENSNQYVGINTLTPGSELDVKGTLRLSGSTSGYVGFAPAAAAGSTTYTIPSADGTSGQVLQTNGSGVLSWLTPSTPSTAWQLTGNSGTNPPINFIGTTDSKDFVFKTYNNERMRIDSVGKVHVNGKVTLGPSSIYAEQFQVAGNALFVEQGYSLGIAPFIRGGHTYTTKTTPDYSWYQDNQTGIFHPALKEIGITTGGSGGFRIDSTGNVGIGTSHSTSIFHVAYGSGVLGTKVATFSYGAQNNMFIAPKLDNLSYDSLSVSGDQGIFWSDNQGSNGTNSTAGLVIAPYSNKNIGIRITSDGNVGIDTSLDTNNTPNRNPNNYKLAVNGNIGAKEVFVEITSTTWPDYVFDKKYELLSLKDVESYIDTNSHLPNVPSASEIGEKGIAVGEMNAVLLKKVEELTLYLIEQNKIINEFKERISTLESKIKQ